MRKYKRFISTLIHKRKITNINLFHLYGGWLLFFIFFHCNILLADQKRFYFEGITNERGLTHNTVFDICQDDKGFMWFATDGGLNRFDGQNIKQYFAGNNQSLPSNSVTCINFTPDSLLFAGTLKGLALYQPETDNFKQILTDGKPIGEIIDMQMGKKDELLISTENKGAFIYNYKIEKFNQINFARERIYGMTTDREGYYWAFTRFAIFRFNADKKVVAEYNVSPKLFNSAISYLRTDSRGVLWVGTFERGLFNFNFQKKIFEAFVPANKVDMYYIRTIETGENLNEYWIGTEKGLYILNISTGILEHYTQSFDINRNSINDNAVYKIFKNKQKVFFIGTYFGGVNIAKTRMNGFNAFYPDDKPGYLQGKALGAIAKAPDGKLWIATEDAGIAIFNKENQTFTHLKSIEKNPKTISTNNVHALLMDGDICWSGHFMGGLCRINRQNFQVQRFQNVVNNQNSLYNNFVFALHHYSKDSLLVGTIDGVDIFNKKTNTFSRFRQNELSGCFVYDFFTAPDGKIWFNSHNKGIFVLDKNNPGLMKHFQAGDESGLPGNSIISHFIDAKNRIWIGTRGNGLCLFDPKTQKFQTFTSNNLLNNNVIYGILEDKQGQIWVSSNRGISRLNFTDSTSIHFNYRHGIAGNQYNYKSSFIDSDGTMYFGSVKGLTSFNPEMILSPKAKPEVYFSNLKILNENILPGSKSILKKQIDFTEKLKLKYYQNSFTLEFASVNFFEGDINYEYYLEGLEEEWSPLSPKMQANYTNISPGKYTFHIRANNKTGNITGPERILHIVVYPPFWASWFAYLLYTIITITIVYLLYRNHQNRQKEKVALAIEKIEKENLNVLHQHKMNFFTYISHEFKTPLSIIIASLEMLLKKSGSQSEEVNGIQLTIKRSATRLLFLVNQLMEFRKIETDHESLNLCKGNLIDFVNQTLNVYRPLLANKGIDLNVQIQYSDSEILFDFDKLEKIMTNLLTNAVKYTPQNGNIVFSLDASAGNFEFSVRDSGPGMTEIQKGRIFEVFYGEDLPGEMIESSGIGLALTAGLVKFLKGEIHVESQPGMGSKFIVRLPVNTDKDEKIAENATYCSERNLADLVEQTEMHHFNQEDEKDENKEHQIVIAEDNKDLLMLLQKNFRNRFHVKCFENGKDAWDYVSQKVPDIVITDIMMPLMSGNELCNRIKNDIHLCHVPVIMLTAKTSSEARMEGLQMGADAYVPKPFSMEELEVRINNILNTRKVLKQKLTELAKIENLQIPATNHDQAFVEKIFSMIQENITNSELNVQFLADQLHISRTNLHNKIKNLLQMNSTEFINTVRINRAKELMLLEDLTLAEITYKVGYNDSAYFNRIFKKMTGMTPGDFRKKTNETHS